MKNKKLIMALTLVFVVGAYFVASAIYKNRSSQSYQEKAQENSEIFVRDYSVSTGPKDAKVTIVEFLDPECESCRQFAPHVKNILSQNEGKVRLVLRYAPFHTNSKFAVKILEAARLQGKYWQTLELLFEKQPEWGSHQNLRPELIWTYLPQIGIDVEKIKTDMNRESITEIINQDILDSKELEVRATPTFFVNGRPLQNFGLNYLIGAVQAELN